MKINFDRVFSVASFFLFCVVVVLLVLSVGKAFGAEVTVTWSHPDQRVDGTPMPITEIESTILQWGADGPTVNWTNEDGILAPATTWTRDIASGKWCFRAATKDTDGLQSDWTGPVCANLKAKPNQPIIIQITRGPL